MKKRALFTIIIFSLLILSTVQVSATPISKTLDFFTNLVTKLFSQEKTTLGPLEKELSQIKPFDKVGEEQRITKILKEGTQEEISGTLETIVIDDFEKDRSEYKYYLIKDNLRNRLYNYDSPLISGTKIRVVGTKLGSEIVVLESETIAEARIAGEENPNLGEQKTLVVMIDFQDVQFDTFTSDNLSFILFNFSHESTVNSFYKEVSYNKTHFKGDVLGPYTIDIDADSCSIDLVEDLAIPKIDSEINFSSAGYKRLIFAYPSPTTCPPGVGTLGIAQIETDEGSIDISISWIKLKRDYYGSDFEIGFFAGPIIHELGHNLGVRHANDWECGEDTVDIDCGTIDYGDWFDVMGNTLGHFNAIHKETIGWFSPSNILETNSNGPYLIEPLETQGDGLKTLKIPTSDSLHYYVEFRRPVGNYDQLYAELYGSEVFDGAMIRINAHGATGDTQLLDNSPSLNSDKEQIEDSKDVVLRLGEIFYDSKNDIMITTLSITDDSLEVYLGSPNCGNSIVDFGEKCDGPNLNEQTCESIGYREGDLSCNSDCKFNVSQCGEFICGIEHIYAGNNFCIAVFDVDSEDTLIHASGRFDKWDDVRNRGAGTVELSSFWNHFFHIVSTSSLKKISRISLPFDTSSIPNNALIQSAELEIKQNPIFGINTHPNSDDFITLVPTTMENPPFLSENDFDQFGSIDNPIELANRVDISEIDADKYILFFLNAQGLANINKTNYTGFGIRGGYDLSTTPNNGESTELKRLIIFGDSPDYRQKPTLTVNYTVPLKPQPPLQEPNPIPKNRYISFLPQNQGRQTALRVKLKSIGNGFESFNGKTAWVGAPKDICETSTITEVPPANCAAPTYKTATLSCNATVYRNWDNTEILNVFGSEIVPGSVYEVQTIEGGCDVNDESCYSAPLEIRTGRFGKVLENGDWDGLVQVSDALAGIASFGNVQDDISKMRTEIANEYIDNRANIDDVLEVLGAFSGGSYSTRQGITNCGDSIPAQVGGSGTSSVSGTEAMDIAKEFAGCSDSADGVIDIVIAGDTANYEVKIGGRVVIVGEGGDASWGEGTSDTSSCTKEKSLFSRFFRK